MQGPGISHDFSPVAAWDLADMNEDRFDELGAACHVACYEMIRKELNYCMTLRDFMLRIKATDRGWSTFLEDAGGLAKYQWRRKVRSFVSIINNSTHVSASRYLLGLFLFSNLEAGDNLYIGR